MVVMGGFVKLILDVFDMQVNIVGPLSNIIEMCPTNVLFVAILVGGFVRLQAASNYLLTDKFELSCNRLDVKAD